MSLHIDKVWRKEQDIDRLVPIMDIKLDDQIGVRTGQMIPLDGRVLYGDAMLNKASITGEPLSVHKSKGAPVFAGTVLDEGQLVLQVTKVSGTGQYDRIVHIIEDSEKLKSNTETRVSHLGDHLVPVTFVATALTYLLTRNITRAYSILMVDFCCALKLSMPISSLTAMHEASVLGISVKGGKVMEDYTQAKTIVFDKTGTLTKAEPKVKEVIGFGGHDPIEMLRLAACLEEHYPHSIANAVVKRSDELHLRHEEEHSEVKYIVAHGIASDINGVLLRIGSYHFIFEDEGILIPEGEQQKFDALPDEYSHLYLSIGGQLAAVILIEDPIKEEAKQTIQQLHACGFEKVVMLTGDSQQTAKAVAAHLGLDDYCAEVLPEDKASYIEQEHMHFR
ncbi:HAD-IC family P-type ATPase [Absicoccus intestinalis]|uniref:Cd(2+)-exporting ATPase n=1 Tax=Absicoccus intestinalis TaxID=2926319 RepID=A0ABU4WJH4_9FIRM|nr:HAD-IC family P-type ATPase [Absicoccus sp. CLA-KB-P134]MDX8416707.1 HAD-IC family P-type ATPase [Absicoccus sp. CLA-KB-P134]